MLLLKAQVLGPWKMMVVVIRCVYVCIRGVVFIYFINIAITILQKAIRDEFEWREMLKFQGMVIWFLLFINFFMYEKFKYKLNLLGDIFIFNFKK